jgi:hypothetical protein
MFSSCPIALQTELREPLDALREGLSVLKKSYQLPIPSLLPRPALMLMGFVASSTYLLEHAIWSYNHEETERDMDVEVFRRWVLEGGLVATIKDVRRTKLNVDQRVQSNSRIVFEASPRVKL